METSVFIARIFGLFYLIIGAGMLFNRKTFGQVLEDFCKNTALLFYGGAVALVIGVVLILTHNVWVNNWTVIITVIGWMALIKGIWIIFFPRTVSKFMQAYRRNKNLLTVHALVALALGVVLSYFGFL